MLVTRETGLRGWTEEARSLRSLLEAALGERAIPSERAARLYEERASRAIPVELPPDQIEELADAITELETAVALRRREAALAQAERIHRLSGDTIDSLLRERAIAGRLFEGCLAQAWLHLQLHEREAARAQLHHCRQIGPDVRVNPLGQHPSVVELLREVDTEIAAQPVFDLALEVVPAASGCAVFLNGRRAGALPGPVRAVPIGDHRIWLECPDGRASRVHRVIQGAEPRSLRIDLELDRVTRTEGGLELVGIEQDLRAARAYARELARTVGATHVVLLSHVLGYEIRWRADRIAIGEEEPSVSILLPRTRDPERGVRAAEALAGRVVIDAETGARGWFEGSHFQRVGRGAGQSGAGETGVGESGAADSGAGERAGGWQDAWTGAFLLAGGALVYGTAIGTYVHLETRIVRVPAWNVTGYIDAQREVTALKPLPITLAAAGSALAIASLPLWLPQQDGVPWWSWISGLVGLGAEIAAGVVWWLNQGCVLVVDGQCMIFHQTEAAGAMWASAGAPFLALPVVYAIREVTGQAHPPVSAWLDVTPERFALQVGGVF